MSMSISRADLAALCVEALTNPAAINVTLEVAAAIEGHLAVAPLAARLSELFDGLQKDAQPSE